MRDFRLSQLRAVRMAKGMSLEEVARESGVTIGTVARIECCEHMPHIVTMRKLAAALGVTPQELLEAE